MIAGRFNTGMSFLKGRSICFSCGQDLKNRDLIPIFSFIFLKGRCRNCGSKIPVQALFVEILMGIISVLVALKSLELGALSLEWGIQYLLLVAIFSILLLITLYDLKHFIIPDSFLVVLFLLALSSQLSAPNLSFLALSSKLLALSLSGLILALPFLLLFLFSRGTWFGLGDVKYIAVFGFWLGFSKGLSAVILAFWIGALFYIGLLLLKKVLPFIGLPSFHNNLTIKSEVPFGPFLSLGVVLSFLLNLDLFRINDLLNLF